MKPSDYLEADTAQILRNLNLANLTQELLSEIPGAERLSQHDWQEISELIYLACDAFLARDLQEFYDVECEKVYGDKRAFLDIVAKCRGTIEPFKALKNSVVIVDWKTTSSPVDNDGWRTRCLRSYQWREYKYREPQAKLFIYRGLSRDLSLRKKGDSYEPAKRVREVILHLPDVIIEDVSHRIVTIDAMREALRNFEVWPKNTQSCDDYGYTCPFLRDCENNTMPQQVIPLREMSYSRRETFLRCPERYRRAEIDIMNASGEDEDDTTIGKVVHAGLERIWKKAFENQ